MTLDNYRVICIRGYGDIEDNNIADVFVSVGTTENSIQFNSIQNLNHDADRYEKMHASCTYPLKMTRQYSTKHRESETLSPLV